MKKKLLFHREGEWPFKRGASRRALAYNTRLWFKWLENLLESLRPGPWNALAVYMSPGNLEFLRAHVYPMDWLNFSPKEDPSLGDNELEVDLDDLEVPHDRNLG